MRKRYYVSAVLVAAISGPCIAQTTGTTGVADSSTIGTADRVDEIIVTAKLRAERLQDVPLSVTAFTGAGLEQRSILDVRDVARFTPNFNYYSGSGRADPTALVVRGLSANTSDERYQGLSFFVDGIYQSGQLTSIDLSQLERVEILRGPQSATFGRATYAGAIDYVTRNPSLTKVEGRVRGTLSTEAFDTTNYVVSARISSPLITDKLALQLNGTVSFRDGRYRSPTLNGTGAGLAIGEERTKAIGAVIFAQPTDRTSIKLRFAYDLDQDTTPLVHIMEPAEWEAKGVPTYTTPGGQLWIRGAIPQPTLGATGGGEVISSAYRPGYPGRDRNRYFASLIIEHQLSDTLTLSYRGGLFKEHYYQNTDGYYRSAQNDIFFGNTTNRKLRILQGTASATDRALVPAFQIVSDELFVNHSHQLRLVSSGETFRFRGGLYYFKEYDRNYQYTFRSATNPRGQSRGAEIAENYAGFAGFDLNISTKFVVSAEARLERDLVYWEQCSTCQVNNVGNTRRNESTFLSPRFTASYKLTPNNLIYAQAARGYKSARLNVSALTLPTALPERLDSYEIGSKNTFGGGRALLNVAGFYNEIKNQQAFFPLPNPLFGQPGQQVQTTGIGNFGNSRIFGFEIETSVVLARGLKFGGGLGYADQKFTQAASALSDTAFFAPGDTVFGKTSINTPKWTANGGFDYTTGIGSTLNLDVRADVTWRSKMFIDRANLAYIVPAAQVGGRIALRPGNDTWSFALFGRNLFDNRTALGAGLSGSSSCYFDVRTNARCLYLTVPRGRELGLDATFKF